MKIEDILTTYHQGTSLNLYLLNSKDLLIKNFSNPLAPHLNKKMIPQIKSKNHLELSIKLLDDQSSIGYFSYQNFEIIALNTNFTINGNGNYDRLAPLLGFQQFLCLLKSLYFMIYQKWPIIHSKSKTIKIGENISTISEHTPTYKGYLAEKEMLNSVTAGNLELFNKRFRNFTQVGNFGSFTSQKLRNEKDMAIAATTLYTRAAIKGGLAIAQAYNLSDKIIQQIEKDTVISNYYEYTRAIGEIFIIRVQRVKRKNLTSIVYHAQEYIHENFMQIEKIDEVAQEVNCSLSYLQHLFSKETGQTIIHAINQEKINLSKHELIFTSKSLAQIAADCGFHSQAIFSTTFKRFEDITPLKFRKSYE
ncbi:AraC-like DNA-binding protein [Lactobacillus colini]|uniref:AraC-like DNA-binding protein n=1 Tax=Lactobacillus colini TaxID=1819254 RepID=A0ABS4MBU1_9LACO|nr:AraC family transcriptional regulator [Lactobacillus colini]MBP2057134.1 AraC-like DNA-binding protein [Lactobacillus colini]